MDQNVKSGFYSIDEMVEFANHQFNLKRSDTKKYYDKFYRAAKELIDKGELPDKKEPGKMRNRFVFSEKEMWIIFQYLKDYLKKNSSDYGEAVKKQFNNLQAEVKKRLDAEAEFLAEETKRYELESASISEETVDSEMVLAAALKYEKEAMFKALFRAFYTEFDESKLIDDFKKSSLRQTFENDDDYLLIDERMMQPEGSYFKRDDKFAKYVAQTVRDATKEKLDQLREDIYAIQKDIAKIRKSIEDIQKKLR